MGEKKPVWNRSVCDEFDKLELGRTYHHVTCVSVKPIVFECVCGKIIKNRTLTHLNNGMRSCGCMRKGRQMRTLERGIRIRNLEILKKLSPDDAMPADSSWLVRCNVCTSCRVLTGKTLMQRREVKQCSRCPRRDRPNRPNPRRDGVPAQTRVAPRTGEEP